jgi:flagellar biosynthesis protein FliQ
MTDASIVDLIRQTLWVALLLCAPILSVTLVVGLLISVVQAATQINEMTLTFLPKLLCAGIMLIFVFPWMLHLFRDYFTHMVELMREVHA